MNNQHMFNRIVGITLSFMLLGILSLTAYAAGPDPGQAYWAIPAANHCSGISNDAAGSILLAANPELSAVCRYAGRVLAKVEKVYPIFPNTTEPDAAGSADNVQRAREAEAARYMGLAESYNRESGPTSSHVLAENPETMRARSHTAAENTVGLQQKTDAIRRFGLAEVREAEQDAASSDHKLWMPAYLGRITTD